MTTDSEVELTALRAAPHRANLWYALAQRHALSGQRVVAAALLREGLQHCPEQPDLLYLLANTLHHLGEVTEAAAFYRLCISRGPHIVEALVELPLALLKGTVLAEAETAARAAVAAQPHNAEALTNLGTIICRRHRYVEGLAWFERALAITPGDARIYNQAGLARVQLADAATGIALFDKSLALRPGYALAHSNLSLARLYVPAVPLVPPPMAAMAPVRAAGRAAGQIGYTGQPQPLRLGFVSADLRQHVVGLFLLPLFAHRSRGAFEYHVYNVSETADNYTSLIRQGADAWTEARNLDDDALAKRIAADGIDILFDLNGHTANNRLPLFARRAAPHQVSWLGFPGYVGAAGVDWRLSDAVLDPPGGDLAGWETPLRLPHAFFCYTPPAEWGGELPVSGLPAAANGHITFGAFNDMAKVNVQCLAAWAAILRALPGSRLKWRARCFEEAATREHWAGQLAALGIAHDRADLLRQVGPADRHMAVYGEVDIHLDTFPYTGGTTCCDALWHGVPAVTLAGARPSECLGASVLSAAGRRQWITATPEDYVALAVKLARDVAGLQRERAGLRDLLRRSPLCDGPRFARDFEAVCRQLAG